MPDACQEEYSMEHERQHYVNGAWVDPLQPTLLDVIDPSTEESFAQIAVGGPKDVDRAVAAAKAAFRRSLGRRVRIGSTC
jgi:acyl-CoA reductase-like NAD-dependent aldehyde dehydrogenase